MKVKVGERYRSPEDCICNCGKLDCIVEKIDLNRTSVNNIQIRCYGCNETTWLSEEDMLGWEDKSYTLITRKQLVKERLKAPFETK
jgi:hypothetical protein